MDQKNGNIKVRCPLKADPVFVRWTFIIGFDAQEAKEMAESA